MSKTEKKQIEKIINDNTFTLTDFALVIVKNTRFILIIPIIFVLLTITYVSFFAEPTFRSHTKITSSNSGGTSNIGQAAGLAAQFGLDIPGSKNGEWVYPEIIKSRSIAKIMLEREFETPGQKQKQKLLEILVDENSFQTDYERVQKGVTLFLSQLDVFKDGSFYDISYVGNNAKLVRDILDALITEVELYQYKKYKLRNSETRKFIESRIIETEKDLKQAEETLKNFRDRNRRIENSPSLLLEQQRLSREVQVLTGVFTTLKQQFETAKIEEVKDTEYVLIIDHPEIPLYRDSPRKKRAVLLSAFFGFFISIFFSYLRENIILLSPNEKRKWVYIKEVFYDSFKKS